MSKALPKVIISFTPKYDNVFPVNYHVLLINGHIHMITYAHFKPLVRAWL